MSMPSALSRASFILLAVLLLCPVAVGATLREITSEDIASWREIREGALSADGQWLAYQLTPDEGSPQREATVVLRGTQGKVERRYVAGDPERRAGQLRMSGNGHRSEEHTSELQSLMRISNADICLKKKKKKIPRTKKQYNEKHKKKKIKHKNNTIL